MVTEARPATLTDLLGRAPRVLIIDDSRAARTAVRIELEALGFETVEAADGVEGTALALTGSGARKELPVAFHLGATDFLRKPVFAEELVSRVDNMLRIKDLERRLRTEATLDQLTQLPNRRELERVARVEVSRALRDEHALGVLVLDIDFFKRVNDTHGHGVGDEVIRSVAAEVFRQLRTTDIVGRFGGEEFVAFCPKASAHHVRYIGERVRLAIETLRVSETVPDLGCTVSLGGTSWAVAALDRATTLAQLVAPADEALYEAKSQGRNRANVSSR